MFTCAAISSAQMYAFIIFYFTFKFPIHFTIQTLALTTINFYLFIYCAGGIIDQAHHNNQAKLALADTVAMDDAIGVAKEMTAEEDTLIVVTADHSHVFNIAGYPKRGNNILGSCLLNSIFLFLK